MLRRLMPPKDWLVYGSVVLGTALVGAVIITLVMVFDPTAGYFPICALMSLMGLLIAVMLQCISFVGQFNLALSLGARRTDLILAQMKASALVCVGGLALAFLVLLTEMAVYPTVFAAKQADVDFDAMLRWLRGPMVLPAAALGLAGLWVCSMVMVGFYLRFGQKLFLGWPIFYFGFMALQAIARRLAQVELADFLSIVPAWLWAVLGAALICAGMACSLRWMRRHAVSL
jgi:hypothetical protein